MTKLYDLAEAADLKGKINAMFSGEAINTTEDRAVLHVATRAPRDKASTDRPRRMLPRVCVAFTQPVVCIHVYPYISLSPSFASTRYKSRSCLPLGTSSSLVADAVREARS